MNLRRATVNPSISADGSFHIESVCRSWLSPLISPNSSMNDIFRRPKGDIRLRRRAASVGVYWMWELETPGVGLSITTRPNNGLNSSHRGREAGSEKSQRRTVRCLRLQHRQRSSLQSDSEGFFLHSSSMTPLLMPQVL